MRDERELSKELRNSNGSIAIAQNEAELTHVSRQVVHTTK